MELPGANYLYALATISVTFVGFSALLLVIAAVAVLAEIGDLSRFRNPRELMGYLGLVPSESSTGDTIKRGGITKAGNGRAARSGRIGLELSPSSTRFP
jgi:hypothetical protein